MADNRKSSAKMQIVTALLANIPALTYGFQIGWLSPMAPILQAEDSPSSSPLSDNDISWMAAALTLAAVPSVPVFSYTADTYGRKVSIILLSVFSSISWTLKLWSVSPVGLICARVFAGVAAAGCFLVVPVYVREISEDSLRGALGSLLMGFCNIGVILVYILGMYLDYFWNQWIYLAICFVHILLFLLVPESPAFLVKKGKLEKAAKAISWLRGVSIDSYVVTEELKLLKNEDEEFRASRNITIRSIVKDKAVFSAFRLCLVIVGVQALSGCFAIVNYAASIFRRAGTEWSTNALALFVGALQFAGSVVATTTVEKCGRKSLLASTCAIIAACMMTVATIFLADYYGFGSPSRWLSVVAVSLLIFAYGAGLGPVPFIIMAEVFSFQLRARLSGATMMFSWTNSTLTVLLFAPIANAFGEHVVFYAFAMVNLLGAIYTVLFVPETKGKSLDEIRKHFENK